MSSRKYIPPYTVSEEAVNLISEISAAVERFDIEVSGVKGLRLRKTNRIKTIRGSTAIEGNTLTEEQVTAVLEGKKVVAPQREIDEVLGAAAAFALGKRAKAHFTMHSWGLSPQVPMHSWGLSPQVLAEITEKLGGAK